MPSNLPDLPPSVLQRILAEALTADPNLAPTLLSSLGRSIAAAASATLFERILLEDDDSLLVAAEEEEDAPARNVLAAVWRSKEAGGCVRSLTILRPSPIEGRTPDPSNPLEPFTFDGGAAPTDLSEPAPLDPHSFAQLLLPKFTNLTSFTWASSRLPPADLCIALGAAAKNLSSFSLDLASTSTTSGVPGSPRTSIRWDAEQLSALPVSVSQLSLAHLSLEGSRELARAFTLIPNLEKLELSRTLFVDDALLEAMAEGAKRLAKLAIRDMAGTKLTEKGIGAVLDSVDGCTALEELILDSVEGRLSKACWSRISPLPPSLHVVRISFAEQGPHKSWSADHLNSIAHVASASDVHTLEISRRPQDGARILGQHQVSRFEISDVVAPRAMSQALLDAIVAKGSEWRDLDLDFYSLPVDTLKKILDKTTNVRRLKVLLDAPFKSLLTLSSSFGLSQQLRSFTVSVPPAYAPCILPPSFPQPSFSPPTPTTSPKARHSSLPALSPMSVPLSPPQDPYTTLVPATREWRRFLKKTHSLDEIIWGGRGGLGTWRFGNLSKVEFEPACAKPVVETTSIVGSPVRWMDEGRRRTRRASDVSEFSLSSSLNQSEGMGLGLTEAGMGTTRTQGRKASHSPERDRAFPKLGTPSSSPKMTASPSSRLSTPSTNAASPSPSHVAKPASPTSPKTPSASASRAAPQRPQQAAKVSHPSSKTRTIATIPWNEEKGPSNGAGRGRRSGSNAAGTGTPATTAQARRSMAGVPVPVVERTVPGLPPKGRK